MISRKFLFFIVATFFLTGCVTTRATKDNWFGKDKKKHFFLSSLIAGVSTAIVDDGGMKNDQAFGVVMGITLLIGAGKEAKDEWFDQTGWDFKDIVWDILGGVTGFFIVQGINTI